MHITYFRLWRSDKSDIYAHYCSIDGLFNHIAKQLLSRRTAYDDETFNSAKNAIIV